MCWVQLKWMVEAANSVPVGAHKHNGVRPVCLPNLSHIVTPSRSSISWFSLSNFNTANRLRNSSLHHSAFRFFATGHNIESFASFYHPTSLALTLPTVYEIPVSTILHSDSLPQVTILNHSPHFTILHHWLCLFNHYTNYFLSAFTPLRFVYSYVRDAGPSPPRVFPPGPSGDPVPQRDDIHYPSEESTERANNLPPRITGITISSDSTCSVKVSDQVIAVPGVVPTTNSTYEWFAYACVADSGDGRGSMAVLGQTFSRWSRLLYVHAHDYSPPCTSTTVAADCRPVA